MPAERQQCAAFKNRLGVLRRLAQAIDAHTGGQALTFACGNLHVAMGDGAGGQVEHNRRAVCPWRGKRDRVGAEQRAVGAVGNHAGHAVDHAQCHQAFFGKRLDVRPQRGKVMRVVNRQQRDASTAGLVHQQRACRRQCRLGKTIRRVNPHKATGDVFNDGYCLAIDPTAVQRRHIAGHAKHPVAMGAIAFGIGTVCGQHLSHRFRRAVPDKDALQQQRQCLVAQVRGCRVVIQRRCRHR